METTLSLKEEIEMLSGEILNAHSGEKEESQDFLTELRFKELKNILAKFNKEYLFNDYMRKAFLDRPHSMM